MEPVSQIISAIEDRRPLSRRDWIQKVAAIAVSCTAIGALASCARKSGAQPEGQPKASLPSLPADGDALVEALGTPHAFPDRLRPLPPEIAQICKDGTEDSIFSYEQSSAAPVNVRSARVVA